MNGTKRKAFIIPGLVAALITALVYLPALSNGFVEWDDHVYVYENKALALGGVEFLKWAFTSVVSSNWHPLTMLTYGVEYSLWGAEPFGYHLVNVLLHAANTFLVFSLGVMLFRKIVGDKADAQRGVLFAAFASAMVFGIHPQHVESVAWVSERKDVLSGFFFLLAIIFYLRSVEGEKKRLFYWASFSSFVLAVLSKPMAITLPVVLLILDFFPLGRLDAVRDIKSRFIEKIPFILLIPVTAVMTIWAQHGDEAMASFEASPMSERIDVAVRGFVFYLKKLIVPTDLAPFYVRPLEGEFYNHVFFMSLAVLLAMSAVAVVFWKRRAVAAAWMYYVVTLVPVIGIVQVSDMAAADRYSYLPTLGPVFFIAGALGFLITRRPRALAPLAAAFMVLLSFSGYLTVVQTGVWKDTVSLWTQEIRLYPTVQAYMKRARAYEKEKMYIEAAADYTVVIDNTGSGQAELYLRRGVALKKAGKKEAAYADLTEAIRTNPASISAYVNRGELLVASGDFSGGIGDFERALELSPGNPVVLYFAGDAYERAGDTEKGLSYMRQAASSGVKEAAERLKGR